MCETPGHMYANPCTHAQSNLHNLLFKNLDQCSLAAYGCTLAPSSLLGRNSVQRLVRPTHSAARSVQEAEPSATTKEGAQWA